MQPTDEVVAVPHSTTPRQLETVVAEPGSSRYPVRGSEGDVLGFVHIKDVLERLIGDVRDAAAERRRIDDPHASPATRRATAATGAGAGGR